VPGLVPDDVFLDHWAHRRFPAGQFIHRADQLDYLQEPDVFHDVFGHVPMLLNPVMADFIQAYGEGGLRAQRLGALEPLAPDAVQPDDEVITHGDGHYHRARG
jgi:phenylalanine-4-hydroxylase